MSKVFVLDANKKEQSPMLERTIVEKFSEPMAMDTYKGLRAAVIPPLAKALILTPILGRALGKRLDKAEILLISPIRVGMSGSFAKSVC